MTKGNHFFVWRSHHGVPFQHHGIDVGDGTVVHFTDGDNGVAGPGGSTADFEIRQTSIDVVTRGGRDCLHVVKHPEYLKAEVIIERARSQVGRRGYHLIFDNCEHFACWCVTDRDESRQVDVARERLSAASVKAIAATGVRVASRVGVQRVVRGASPLLLVADAVQWATEAGGHHVGLTDPQNRKRASRAAGGVTALSVGALGGPIGIVIAGGIWAAGELAGEVSSGVLAKIRDERGSASSSQVRLARGVAGSE